MSKKKKTCDHSHLEVREELLPGFIEVSNAVQWGEPCLKGTRLPFFVGLDWVSEHIEKPDKYVTREQAIALAAFHAGYEWHRNRARRKRMKAAVEALWKHIAEAGCI